MKKFLFGLLFVLTFGLFSFSDTFALDDVSKTFTVSSTYESNEIFSDALTRQYQYLIVTFSNPTAVTSNSNHYPTGNIEFVYNRTRYYLDKSSALTLYSLPLINTNYINIKGVYWNEAMNFATYLSDTDLTFTLTNNLPGYGTGCPQPEPCEDPEENSRYINVVIDAFWKYHIAFAGAAAGILAIFFVYRIIKGRLR